MTHPNPAAFAAAPRPSKFRQLRELIASPELIIAAAAERTRSIRLGSGVTSLPYHHPLMVVNRFIQLDHMTRGRAMLGCGPGALGVACAAPRLSRPRPVPANCHPSTRPRRWHGART